MKLWPKQELDHHVYCMTKRKRGIMLKYTIAMSIIFLSVITCMIVGYVGFKQDIILVALPFFWLSGCLSLLALVTICLLFDALTDVKSIEEQRRRQIT